MNRFQRAIQIWALLVVAARERKTYTYGQLAAIFEYERAGTLGQLLAPLMFYCEAKGYPPLTILVVNQETQIPGPGGPAGSRPNYKAVHDFKWFFAPFPTVEELEEATRRAA